MVITLRFISVAICLLINSATTCLMTAFSRGLATYTARHVRFEQLVHELFAAACKRAVDGIEHVPIADTLRQVIQWARYHRSHWHFDVAMTRDERDRDAQAVSRHHPGARDRSLTVGEQ